VCHCPLANSDWGRTFSELFQPKLEARSSSRCLILLNLVSETCTFELLRVALATISRDRMLLMTTRPCRALALAVFPVNVKRENKQECGVQGRLVS
jgi:hypothetical protein